jgi:hypothetical protein
MRPARLALILLIGCGLRCPAADEPKAIATSATLTSDDTSITVTVVDDAPAVTSLKCRASGFDWIGNPSRAIALPLIDAVESSGNPVSLHWRFTGMSTAGADNPAAATFTFTAADAPSGTRLELLSTWQGLPTAEPGPIEHRIVIHNRGSEPLLLPIQPSLALAIRAPAAHTLERWWVEKGAGTPTPAGIHRDTLTDGTDSVIRCWPSGRDEPRDAIPWISVHDVQGHRGFYAGVEWTARVELALKPDVPAGDDHPLHLRLGLMPDDKFRFFTRLAPGEHFDVPPAFIGCYAGGDTDDGANHLRRWVRAHVAPPARDDHYPLLTNNSWGSGMAVDEKLARSMIDESATLGLEMFHIDAGWFRTVGDWRPDSKKFPQGLAAIADYTHAKQLKFGLWVGWTQGGDQPDPTGAHAILSVHDPAMAPWFCQRYPANWKANEFTGATVCLAEPKAADWCLDHLRTIIRENKLDLFEHDQTVVTDGCDQPDGHTHTCSRLDAGYRAAQGYYRIYDTLRTENPNLLFENCVNGGHMIDYGALRRCHYISITDTYDPLSNRRAFYDATYALPPAMCECYVQHEAALADRGLPQFRFMLRSGMMGWCTIMTDTRKWTAQQHEAARQEFAQYKERLRPLIKEADLYHVSLRPDGVRWDGIEYVDAHRDRGALFAFRGSGDEAQHAFVLKGLEPEARYALTFQDGSAAANTVSGRDLMGDGLRVSLREPQTSEIVHIEKQ